jgi:hypothetical protein
MSVDNYLTYVIEKFFVFHPLAELDESNTVDDIDIFKRENVKNVNTKKKMNDKNMIELTKDIFNKFKIYNICVKDPIVGYGDNLKTDRDAENIYMMFKKYKNTSSKTVSRKDQEMDQEMVQNTDQEMDQEMGQEMDQEMVQNTDQEMVQEICQEMNELVLQKYEAKFYLDNDLDSNHSYFVAKVHLNFYQMWTIFRILPCVYESGKSKYEWKFKHVSSDTVISIYDWNNKDSLLNTKLWYIGSSSNDKKIVGEFLSVLCDAIQTYNVYYKQPIEEKTFTSDNESVDKELKVIKRSLVEKREILKKL